ncbi:MAG: T9SS type A sorting domain-containing protein [Gemmatimonadetes bacterium]|nr:T9SS type A sorting domain-containing protein [Gemmatimonadota bacterium]
MFDLTGSQPVRTREIMVGLEPVSVRQRTANEVWVVNHVSDDISIVDLSLGRVVTTLQTGDEPTDVCFANGRAFVVVSQEDRVLVFDTLDLTIPPIAIDLALSDPRSIALSAAGNHVYVNALEGGNRTTAIDFQIVSAGGGPPAPDPPMNGALPPAPDVGLIVRQTGGNWLDEDGGNWNAEVPYTVLDHDVAEIDVATLNVTRYFEDVGTNTYNIAVNPVTGELLVTGQEADNLTRFVPKLRAAFLENRVTRVDAFTGAPAPVHLNSHINYGDPAGNASERALSLSMPLDVAFDSSGTVAYVASFGSGKVGVLDAAGNVTGRIDVEGGPAGLALDEGRNRLYVYHRFASSLGVVDLGDFSLTTQSLGFDPTPQAVLSGRPVFYESEDASAHGDLSCASCHLFGGLDGIAWDLGDPTASSMIPPASDPFNLLPDFHPMKGPMTTQSLKGLAGTEPLHWRGDKAALADFNSTFPDLLGRASTLPAGTFQMLEDFVFSMRYPSNPFRSLDNQLPAGLNGADPVNGEQLFLTGGLVGGAECVSCHALPTGENGLIIPAGALQESEGKVVPQLRNMYEKTRFDNQAATTVRGFGYIHDGSVDDLFTFLDFSGFNFASTSDQEDVAAFLLAFDTGTHPGIGAQWTFDGGIDPAGSARLATLEGEADAGAIGLVAKGTVSGQPRGWTYAGGGFWTPDKESEADIAEATLLATAGVGTEITITGVPDGCQWRLGVDRDLDGYRDGDERDAGSDPGDPASTPQTSTDVASPGAVAPTSLRIAGANPTGDVALLQYNVSVPGPARLEVFDLRGRRIRTLANERQSKTGTYAQQWNLRNEAGDRVPSGVYFVRLRAADKTDVRKITVIH